MNFLSVRLWGKSCVTDNRQLSTGSDQVRNKMADTGNHSTSPRPSPPPPSPATPSPPRKSGCWTRGMALWRLFRRLVCSVYQSAKSCMLLLLSAVFLSVMTHVPLDLSVHTALPFFYKTGACYFLCDVMYFFVGRLFPRHRTRLTLALGCLEFLLSLAALDAILNGRRQASYRRLSNACAGDYEYVACHGCFGDEHDLRLDLVLVTFVVFYSRRRRWDIVDTEEEKTTIRGKVKSAFRSCLRLFVGVLIGVIALPLLLGLINAAFGYKKKMAPGETWTQVTSLARLLLAIDAVGVVLNFIKPKWGGTLTALTSSVEYFALATWCRHFSSTPVDPRDLSNVMSSVAKNITSAEALARYLDPDYASSVLIGSRAGCPAPGGVARLNTQLSMVCSLVDSHNVRNVLLDLVILGVILFRPRALWT